MYVIKEQKQPLFFLFTCVKDGNDYIDKLFDSLLKQTKINFIHFIYEDGSSKPLGNKVIEYQNKVANLKNPYHVIYEYNPVNIGLNRSTQYCISKCNCPYFIWIDCDNFVDFHFFEELEKTYKRNKKSILLRSTLCNGEDFSLKLFNAGTTKEVNSKYQLGLFIRRRYYYSFFAVNYSMYRNINPRNIMLDDRSFYNDEQVLVLCLLNFGKIGFSKKSIGYFTTRNDQESSIYHLSLHELRDRQLHLCELVNPLLRTKLQVFYDIKSLYEQLNTQYQHNYTESIKIIKHIKKLSKTNKISLKNYYDSNLLKCAIKTLFWRFKVLWKN